MSPSLLSLLALALLLLLALYILHDFLLLITRQLCSPLRTLPGPPSPSFFMGNLEQMHDMENTNLISAWVATHGHSFVYRGFIGGCRLMTTDPLAIAHVLGNAYHYPKPDFIRDSLASMVVGRDGLLTVEGETHRRQRKILSPAFSTGHIKSLTPIFWDKAIELRDIWFSQVDDIDNDDNHNTRGVTTNNDDTDTDTTNAHDPSVTRIDVLLWLGRATLDVIGLAGFGYAFDALAQSSRLRSSGSGSKTTSRSSHSPSTQHDSAQHDSAPNSNSTRNSTSNSNQNPLDELDEEESATETDPQEIKEKDQVEDKEQEQENELAHAFGIIFSTARKFRVMTILQVWFPFLRRFRRNNTTMLQAQATMRRIGLELIEEKRCEVLFELGMNPHPNPGGGGGGKTYMEDEDEGEDEDEEKRIPSSPLSPRSPRSPGKSSKPRIQPQSAKSLQGRDILSVLIRSNLSSDPSQQMSEEEVLCQISTFLAAGHETTSSALTWCLYALARDRRVQEKLRGVVRALEVEGGGKSGDEGEGGKTDKTAEGDLTDRITRCTYLDWVVRESLRVHAPVTTTMRVCMRDEDEIPVRSAVLMKGSTNGNGNGNGDAKTEDKKTQRSTIPVRKWDIISVPIQAINKSEVFWGEDASVFRPERWAAPPQDARAIPGLYANTLTFLNGNPLGGNRACIGYKFALIEIKIFLYVLVKDLEFSIDPSMVIEKKVNVVTRPFVKSEPHLGNQMPLNISRASPSASVLESEAQVAEAPTISPPPTLFSNK